MNLPRLYLHTVRQFFPVALAILFGISLQLSSAADPPGILNHQGRIAVNGLNFDGNGQFKFALVDGAGDTSLWSNDGTSMGGGQPVDSVAVAVAAPPPTRGDPR